jgi:glycosyltransferase involved in cell wall biosynthesis
MRLTLLNQYYRPDIAPTAQLAASLAEHRAALGDDVTVVTGGNEYVAPASAGARSSDSETERGSKSIRRMPRIVRVWTLGLGKKIMAGRLLDYLVFTLGAVYRVAVLPRQDVIVAMTTPPFVALAAVAHKFFHRRTKIVLWSMDAYLDAAERLGVMRKGSLASRLLRWVECFLFRHVDHLVCLDNAMLELLVGQYAPRAKKGRRALEVSVIPNWEDLALFPRGMTPAPWPERQLLGLEGMFVVLYLGNTGIGHGFETVLDAAEQLRDAGDRVRFLFIGGGVRWPEIEAEKARRGLDNVILKSYVAKEQTPAVMGTADAALITLRDEALGINSPSKLHANLAMSLPVIYVGPKGGNVDEAIERFGCGLSLRHGDVQGLIRFIRRLASSNALHTELRSRARRAFDEAYCDAKTLPQFDRVFPQPASASARCSGNHCG